MIELNCRSFLSEFNASKFVIYLWLFFFSFLIALKLDGYFPFSYVFVFAPLWILDIITFVGFFVGLVSFLIQPPARTDFPVRNDFYAMFFCFLEHIILIMFQVLVCYKLEMGDSAEGVAVSWLVVFIPLFAESFLAMIVSVWSIRHDKTFEFELLFSINIIQFVFIAFKLDGALNWSWTIVFVPTWVMFSLCFIGAFYSLILAIFLSRSSQFINTNRRSHLASALSHLLLTIPLLVFFVMLCGKLDATEFPDIYANDVPFLAVFFPLIVFFLFSLTMSFGSKSGNTWWFGMRKPFCNFVFENFPCLQQYANISYKFGNDAVDSRVPRPNHRHIHIVTLGTSSPSPSATSEEVRMLRLEEKSNNMWGLPGPSSIEIPD
uniref:Transmembrane protein 185B n=1 Tax=Panagrellus redivivus TaxID=6233 RepID=A0A7E4V1V1_PANRE